MERIDLTNKKILITGGAGFIGSNLILALLKKVEGVQIISIDNMNEYYDLSLKKWRVEQIQLELSNHVDKSVKMIESFGVAVDTRMTISFRYPRFLKQ